MDAKHTDGPWVIGAPPPNGEQTIGTVSGLMVAVATTGGAMRKGETEANARLIAAAPELLEALGSTIDLLWIEDSHSVQFDGTVMFSPSYDFSGLNGGLRSEFLWPGFDCIVWPGGRPDRKWSAYCTYEGSMWFEKFDTEEQAKEQCFRLLEQAMPEHPVSKARAAITKATGEQQ